MNVSLTVSLDEDGNLVFLYNARTDRPTIVNLTNHAYWNLAGAGSGEILNHTLWIQSNRYLETEEDLLPTGRILSAKNTPADFYEFTRIGSSIPVEGYDHYYILDKEKDSGEPDLILSEETSGRMMELTTDCPGIQFYTGKFPEGITERTGNLKTSGLSVLSRENSPML